KTLRVEQPHEGRHPTNTWASASPSTDGEHVIAFFGSHGIYALTPSGDTVWSKDLGDMDTRNGWGRRGVTRALPGSGHRDVGSRGSVVHRGARQADRQGDLAAGARRADDVGHAARGRAGIADADRDQRDAPRARVRLRHGRGD